MIMNEEIRTQGENEYAYAEKSVVPDEKRKNVLKLETAKKDSEEEDFIWIWIERL